MSGRGNTSVWNIITVGDVTLQQAISLWWTNSTKTNEGSVASSSSSSPMLYHDCYWNATGVPPAASSLTSAVYDEYHSYAYGGRDVGGRQEDKVGAPIVPPWTSRYFCNPTCRGFPWY